jgi:hypothetical protein
VSARHQVKRPDRSFRRVRSFENRSGRRNKFSSFGADHWSAISPATFAQVKSGPDVFADALVPRAAADAGAFDCSQTLQNNTPRKAGLLACALPRTARRDTPATGLAFP